MNFADLMDGGLEGLVDRIQNRLKFGRIDPDLSFSSGTVRGARVKTPTTDLDFSGSKPNIFQSNAGPYSVLTQAGNTYYELASEVKEAINAYLTARGPLNYDAPLTLFKTENPRFFTDLIARIGSTGILSCEETYTPVFWSASPDDGSQRMESAERAADRYREFAGSSLVDQAQFALLLMPLYETSREAVTSAKFNVQVRKRGENVTYIIDRVITEEWTEPTYEIFKDGKDEIKGNHIGDAHKQKVKKDRIVLSAKVVGNQRNPSVRLS